MSLLVTTAPPVARAAKMLMMSTLIMSTRDTPLTAASPALDTITTSAMPTATASSCSTTSGQSRAVSSRPENRGRAWIFSAIFPTPPIPVKIFLSCVLYYAP